MTAPTSPRSSLGLAELLRARLVARQDALGVRGVYGVLDFTAAEQHIVAPCVAVMVLADDFGPPLDSDDDEVVVQRHTVTIAVTCVVPAYGDPGHGGGAEDRLTPLITGVREALLGWSPEGEYIGRMVVRTDATWRSIVGPSGTDVAAAAARWSPLVLRRGRLAAINDGQGRAWWMDHWATHRPIRGAPEEIACPAPPTDLCVSTFGDDPVRLEEVA